MLACLSNYGFGRAARSRRFFDDETVALGGVVCILGSIFFGWRLPKLRRDAREIIVALQMTGGEPASKASFQQPTLASSEK